MGMGGFSVLSENNNDNTQYQGMKKSIKELRDIGGDATIAFGGLNGVTFWEQTQDENVLYNTYKEIVEGYKLTRIDLDIEGTAQSKALNITNAKAIKRVQDETGVDVVLTTGFTKWINISTIRCFRSLFISRGRYRTCKYNDYVLWKWNFITRRKLWNCFYKSD